MRLNNNSVLLRSKARATKWKIQKRWSQASNVLWLNCTVFVWHSEFGPGAAPIPFSSRLCVNKLAHFDKKVLWKRERGQVVGQHFCSTHTLIRAGISITLAHNDLYWSQQPEQEKGRTCIYRRGMDKKRQHRRKEVGRDRDRDGDDKGEEWGLEENKDAVIISVRANYCFLILCIDRSICAHPAQCCLLLLREIQYKDTQNGFRGITDMF